MEIKHIGKRIDYRLLRDIILDENLTENDTIILNPKNFNDIVIEYLEEYKQSMTFPHLLLGVLLREIEGESIAQNSIGIIRGDVAFITTVTSKEFECYDDEVFYRCGLCGDVVDKEGKELEGQCRERAINYIENCINVIVEYTSGKCSTHRHEVNAGEMTDIDFDMDPLS